MIADTKIVHNGDEVVSSSVQLLPSRKEPSHSRGGERVSENATTTDDVRVLFLSQIPPHMKAFNRVVREDYNELLET